MPDNSSKQKKRTIGIFEAGLGNIGSVLRMIEKAGGKASG